MLRVTATSSGCEHAWLGTAVSAVCEDEQLTKLQQSLSHDESLQTQMFGHDVVQHTWLHSINYETH